MRDIDEKPYSADELRVARWWSERVGVGGGDDPIGGLIASHETVVWQRNRLLAALRLFRSLVEEGGVPRYTVLPGAALNTLIEEDVDPLLRELS